MFSNGSSSSISLAMVTPSAAYLGRAELLVQYYVSATWAERYANGVGHNWSMPRFIVPTLLPH